MASLKFSEAVSDEEVLQYCKSNFNLSHSGFIKSKALNKVRISAASLECVGHLGNFNLLCNTHMLRMSRNKLGLIIDL